METAHLKIKLGKFLFSREISHRKQTEEENGGKNEEEEEIILHGAWSRCVTIDGVMRRRLIKDSVQMSFARPPRNFTLALFLFDSRKGPSTRSLPLPFSLIQTPKPENPNPRLKTAKEPPKVKIISFFFLFSFFSLLLSHSLEET